MNIHKMKNIQFDHHDTGEWKETAVRSLKGKPFESLITSTLEGIDLQPLYTNRDEKHVKTVAAQKKQPGWIISQETSGATGAEFIEKFCGSVERGNEAIVYNGADSIEWDEESLVELAKLMTKYPILFFNLTEEDTILRAFDFVHHEVRDRVNGLIDLPDWVVPIGFDRVRNLCANAFMIHHDGADAVTELAFVLAAAAEMAAEQESFQSFAERFYVRFAVDTHFFMEISKLRAFRILWEMFAAAYEEKEAPFIPVTAVTSLRSYSKIDPYVNLLRGGNEAFAAVLGGADYLTVYPHDYITGSSAASERHARNIQLIIKEETHVSKVNDPAAGSYFIETLTNELCEKAYALFLNIMDAGGLKKWEETNPAADIMRKRQNDAASAKKPLIGTNVYTELIPFATADVPHMTGVRRLAEPFELFRMRTIKQQPKTVLLNIGALKECKPQADFVTNFLSAAGIGAEWSPPLENADEACAFLQETKAEYAVVCGPQEQVMNLLPALLKQKNDRLLIDVAGRYDDTILQPLQKEGLNGTIHKGQDILQKADSILTKWEGESRK